MRLRLRSFIIWVFFETREFGLQKKNFMNERNITAIQLLTLTGVIKDDKVSRHAWDEAIDDCLADHMEDSDEDQGSEAEDEVKHHRLYFSHPGHLALWLWATSLLPIGEHLSQKSPPEHIAGLHNSALNVDDFLAVLKMSDIMDDAPILEPLKAIISSFADTASLKEHNTLAEIRESVREEMSINEEVELGCHVYASMISTVEPNLKPEICLRRWQEVYSLKLAQALQVESNAHAEMGVLLPFIRRAELFREQRSAVETQLTRIAIEAQEHFWVEQSHQDVESDFECPRCGSFKTKPYLLQTKSADEPMTQFWRCFACKKGGRED